MAEILLQNKIDFNAKDIAGRTPIKIARNQNNYELVKMIEFYEINTKLRSPEADTDLEKLDLN